MSTIHLHFNEILNLYFRYVCLLCNKLFTSRYNIRMHLNTHTGRNVHTCPYCNIQFISRQSYESHIKVHQTTKSQNPQTVKPPNYQTESTPPKNNLNIIRPIQVHSNGNSPNKMVESSHNGPQIVSVKSINTFDNEAHEEIEIEPDIIEEDNYQVEL